MFEKLTQAHKNDPTIAWAMQFQQLVIGLDIPDGRSKTLAIGPTDIQLTNGLAKRCDLTFRAAQKSWREFSKAEPAIGFQALSSMCEKDHMDIDGENKILFGRFSMLLEKLFATLRTQKTSSPEALKAPFIEAITGRYLHMNLDGHHHRIYFEEAGQGTPLICLHTAGSDGRQYRALLNDPEITAGHRVIAFDMPAHGKSPPKAGFEREIYMLTTKHYMDMVLAFKEALELENPIVMGCSIGGRAVLHLALHHGEHFRAAIGLQSAIYAKSHINEKMDLLDKAILFRPDIDSGEAGGAAVRQIMSPMAPSHHYWETIWYYMQSAPGIFAGDLYYYMVDGDMRNGIAERIDTQQCPLYLLTGEYDLSATPQMTAELAKAVKAQHFEVMKGLGHFPMSEDPETFRNYLLPVLEKIKNQDQVNG